MSNKEIIQISVKPYSKFQVQQQVFPFCGMGEVLPLAKFCQFLPHLSLNNNFHVITQKKLPFYLQSLLLYHFLTSYSLYKQVMLILILINVQYLQNVVFSFEKGLNGQNHSSSDFYHLIFPPTWEGGGWRFLLFLDAIWTTLMSSAFQTPKTRHKKGYLCSLSYLLTLNILIKAKTT